MRKPFLIVAALAALIPQQLPAQEPHFRSLGNQSAPEQVTAERIEAQTAERTRYEDALLDTLNLISMEMPLTFPGFRSSGNITGHRSLKAPAPIMSLTAAGNALTLKSLSAKRDSTLNPELRQYEWAGRRLASQRIISQARYNIMISDPGRTEYIEWLLPDPPKLIDTRKDLTEEVIYTGLPSTIEEDLPPSVFPIVGRTNWLHTFNGGVQFSQAYLSPNWYQGGNNSLTLLVNFLWSVKLNEVYHPNLLFDNSLSYKLGVFSTPQDEYHNYNISEDIFQWNFKFGFKAWKKWFYSFTAQFKTQFLNNYGENSLTRKASFLSPGSLTLGLGMTYAYTNPKKTLKFNASISPLSYNLNTCIDTHVDPTQYNIKAGRKTASEYGSNAELTLEWNMTSNISYRSRLFAFSNYKYFLTDWENTFSFAINRFLSTQIYVHLRYDSSTSIPDVSATKRWRYWMLKEILSFGFAYTFSTK